MKTKGNKRAMSRYAAILMAAVLVVILLTLLLSSCTQTVEGGRKGERFTVDIRVSAGDYQTGNPTRTGSHTPRQTTAVSPLSPGLVAVATLTETEDVPTRDNGNNGFNPDALLRIVAIPTSTDLDAVSIKDYESTFPNAIYKASGGDFTAVGDPLAVEAGSYYFLAYSMNSSTYVPSFASIAASPETDDFLTNLVGSNVFSDVATTIGQTNTKVYIYLTRFFPEVKLTITPSSGMGYQPTIADLSITTPGYVRALDGSTSFIPLSFTKDGTLSTPTAWHSKPRMVSPSQETDRGVNFTMSVTLNFTSLGDLVMNDRPIVLAGMELLSGYSYDLKINFKLVEFAGSNIYYDGSKLTFDVAGQNTNGMRQGVYFLPGSLIGINSFNNNSGMTRFNTNSTTIYVPTGTGYNLTTAGSMGWSVTSGSGGTSITSATVPYLDNGQGLPWDTWDEATWMNAVASNATNNTAGVWWNSYLGDICMYVSARENLGNYRLPMPVEFGTRYGDGAYNSSGGSEIGWTRIPTGSNATFTNGLNSSNDGVSTMTNGAQTFFGVQFPAAGCIPADKTVNVDMAYATSAIYTSFYPAFWSKGDNLVFSTQASYFYGLSVRCVKN